MHWLTVERVLRAVVRCTNWIAQKAMDVYWWSKEKRADWEIAHGYYTEYESMDDFIASLDVEGEYMPPHGWCTNCKELAAGSVGGLCDECRPLAFDALLNKGGE